MNSSHVIQRINSRRRGPLRLLALLASALALTGVPPSGADAPPRPAGGTDVRVSQEPLEDLTSLLGPGDVLSPVCNAQAEPHLAVTDETVVAGWIDDRDCEAAAQALLDTPYEPPTPYSVTATAYSDDGGRTWSDSTLLSYEDGQLRGDPVLAAGEDGTVHFASRAINEDGRSQIVVMTSDDHGRTFGAPVDASPGRGQEVEQDKPWLAVDTRAGSPDRGTIHVVWSEFDERPLSEEQPFIVTVLHSRSIDGGATFSDPVKLSVPVDLDGMVREFAGVGAQVAIGPGGEVYVAWTDYIVPQEAPQYRQWAVQLWFTRSLDGGRTFEEPHLIARPTGIGHVGLSCVPPEPGRTPIFDQVFARDYTLVLDGGIQVRNWPSMTVDVSGSSGHSGKHGRIYLALAHTSAAVLSQAPNPLADEADVYLLHSDGGGAPGTWEGVDRDLRPITKVNDDATIGSDQFHPIVAVDEAGVAALAWYDRRGSAPTNTWVDVYMATTTDGVTFSENVRISDGFFMPPQHHNPFTTRVPEPRDFVGGNSGRHEGDGGEGGALPPIHGGWASGCNHLGEYNGLVSPAAGEFLVAWGDNRDGLGQVSDMDIYLDRMTLEDWAPPGNEVSGRPQRPDAGP